MVLNISPAAPAAVTRFSILGPACPRENAAMMTAKNTANMSPGNKMFSGNQKCTKPTRKNIRR